MADLNGDGNNEKLIFEVKYEDERISSMSILNIKIYNGDKLIYQYSLRSREYKDYFGNIISKI